MRALLATAVLVLATLAAVGAALTSPRGQAVVVPAPEVVAESFLRSLQTHRYGPARRYLSSTARAALPAKRLAAWQGALERDHGRSRDVRGVQTGEGRAAAELHFAGGRLRVVSFPVVQEHGEWRIHALEPLRP